MSYKRQIMPTPMTDQELTSAVSSIGFNLSSVPKKTEINIEDTLFFASKNAIQSEDYRTLSILTNWLNVHSTVINVDRLAHLIDSVSSLKFRAYWASIALWLKKDSRFSKIKKLYTGPKINLLEVGSEFQIARFGEDKRFINSFLKVPANLLRIRDSDILPPQEVAKKLRFYFNRTLIGPSYRADMWTHLELEPNLTVSQLAKKAYGSFATAWRVKKDWEVLTTPRPTPS